MTQSAQEQAFQEQCRRAIKIESEIRLEFWYLPLCVREQKVPEVIYLDNSVCLCLDFEAFFDVRRTLGARTIRFVGDKPLRVDQSHRLVIADRVQLLASGDVVHRLTILRQAKWVWILETVYAMKSHSDDAWISAPTERGVKLRLRNHIRMLDDLPAPVLPDEPYRQLTEEELIDELAFAGVF